MVALVIDSVLKAVNHQISSIFHHHDSPQEQAHHHHSEFTEETTLRQFTPVKH